MGESTKHPFKILVGKNPIMKCFDLSLQVGNFKSEEEANVFAKELANFMEKNANATVTRVQ